MEKLNAEQVKKALECCTLGDCTPCPYHQIYVGCRDRMAEDALALINKQETEYNELYELCESYRIERDAMRGAANSYKLHYKTLEKENEGLKTLLDESYDTQNSLAEENERLKKILSSVARFDTSLLCAWCREEQTKKIAKELLEGKK